MINSLFKNKIILVTGGTGSFGQEFVKILCKNYNFKKLAILSRDELKQFEMSEKIKDKRLRFLLGDIRDYERLKFAFRNILSTAIETASSTALSTAIESCLQHCIKHCS